MVQSRVNCSLVCQSLAQTDSDQSTTPVHFPTPHSNAVAHNGMAAQRKAVEDYLNGGRWKLVAEFTEVESGKRSDRPEEPSRRRIMCKASFLRM
jgi:hypothetical protein